MAADQARFFTIPVSFTFACELNRFADPCQAILPDLNPLQEIVAHISLDN